MSTGRDLTELVRPPRSLFVNFPMGNPFGPANQPDYQRNLLRTALEMVHQITTPGEIVDLKDTWADDFADKVTKSLLAM